MALAKRFFDFHLGIPGHSGVGWVAVMLAGSAMGRPSVRVVAGLSARPRLPPPLYRPASVRICAASSSAEV